MTLIQMFYFLCDDYNEYINSVINLVDFYKCVNLLPGVHLIWKMRVENINQSLETRSGP